jgi:hypothetical protein
MITKLPDEILLWVFDFYRQSFGHWPSSEREWNNKNGWFKLAHVCRNWRCIVLSSSSRLRLRLYFTDKTPTRAAVLTHLPPLPIIVDYLNRDIVRTVGAQNRLDSALRYPNRVCGIAMAVTFRSCTMIFNALDTCFPTLESLIINNMGTWEFNFPPTFLMTSTKSLRRLKIGVRLASLPPLLSGMTALIDLTLNIDTIVCPQQDVSLLSLLQSLPWLRHLDLYVRSSRVSPIHAISAHPTKSNDIISLAELTHFRFEGSSSVVEEFVARLTTPSLQGLHASTSLFRHYQIEGFQIPHLTKFIRNAGMVFLAAQLKFTFMNCNLSLSTHSHFVDDPPFTVMGNGQTSIARRSSALSTLLATVEDVLFAFRLPAIHAGLYKVDLSPWRGFFEQLPNVKILRVQHGIEREVAGMLRQGIGQPTTGLLPVPDEEVANMDAAIPSDMPIDSSLLGLTFLPSLERIEVYMKSPGTPIPESERVSALKRFETLFTARRQVDRPVKVHWNADQVLPASLYDANGWPQF